MSVQDSTTSSNQLDAAADIFKDRRVAADRRSTAVRRSSYKPGANNACRRTGGDRRRKSKQPKSSCWWLQADYTDA